MTASGNTLHIFMGCIVPRAAASPERGSSGETEHLKLDLLNLLNLL